MGDTRVRLAKTQADLNSFTRYLLRDLEAMDRMLKMGWFESDEMKIGAEQEMCLVDSHGKPSPNNLQILDKLNNPNFVTELAKFNIEANITPLPFTNNCFSDLEKQILDLTNELRAVAREVGTHVVLTGILPTIRKFDINIDNLTPNPRYYALMEAISSLRGDKYELRIEGPDELNVITDSALIEACNTSFQVHLQIKPDEFVNKYNIAQAIAAPVLAVSTNSPILFNKRLWSETRIALFRQSIDTRLATEHLRERSPRVTFGTQWLKGSILNLYKEDIMRFRIMFMSDIEEDVLESIEKGITPKLRALSIHNSTVYRWNRACYGISPSGKPHLRIENRVFPAGPSIVDEVANAAFWIGLMNGFTEVYPDITKVMDFDDAKSNFLITARAGLGSKFVWANGKKIIDMELIEKELIPIAREGLKKANVSNTDIDKYLGIIEERNSSGNTGSRWMLNSFSKLTKETAKDDIPLAITGAIMKYQDENLPVSQWKEAGVENIADYLPSSLLVEEFMTTDLFTVSKDDIPELAADMTDWRRIRYLPIENEKGVLIGLITNRNLLRHFRNRSMQATQNLRIEDLMIKDPITISPHATINEAIQVMMENRIGCLPVVNKGVLVGIITEADFLNITARLLKRMSKGRNT
ncbi:MAG: glutamate-cysteine ligase family protein [Thermoflexibacter sp.]|jgi:CBS domain-containing protein|nr:glutamate-cysteine ligase family protein [Thermoflexibacter sp.]